LINIAFPMNFIRVVPGFPWAGWPRFGGGMSAEG
jgi:hypothetical protein